MGLVVSNEYLNSSNSSTQSVQRFKSYNVLILITSAWSNQRNEIHIIYEIVSSSVEFEREAPGYRQFLVGVQDRSECRENKKNSSVMKSITLKVN